MTTQEYEYITKLMACKKKYEKILKQLHNDIGIMAIGNANDQSYYEIKDLNLRHEILNVIFNYLTKANEELNNINVDLKIEKS